MVAGYRDVVIRFASFRYLDRKETHVNEYIPFFVIGIFGVLLFFGTIIWTECLFPENKKPQPTAKQKEFEFKKSEQGHAELVSSHR